MLRIFKNRPAIEIQSLTQGGKSSFPAIRMAANGWEWMGMDENGWEWMGMDENGCEWMRMDENG